MMTSIVKEVTNWWLHKLNFPHLSLQVVQPKLDKLLKAYKKCVKQGNYVTLNNLFNITKENGKWPCNDDKKLYRL